MPKTLTILAAALGFAASAQAHQLWIEQPAGQQAVIRFGEFGDNLRETSPGLLDKFVKPTATLVTAKGEQPVDGVKAATGFTLPFKVGKGETIVAEDALYPLNTYRQGDKEITSWYHPAARYVTGHAAVAPRLTLDLVPTGKAGEFKVVFKGEPKAKVKVSLVVPSGWAREAHSDDAGLVAFPLPWRGTYVAEASFTDRTPGERGGQQYDAVSYVTSLTLESASGGAPLAAGPAAAPNK